MRAERFDVRRKSRRDRGLAERNRQARIADDESRLAVAQRIFGVSQYSSASKRSLTGRPRKRRSRRAQRIEPLRFDRADETQRGVQILRAARAAPRAARRAARPAPVSAAFCSGVGCSAKNSRSMFTTGCGSARSRFSAYSTAWRRTASRLPSNWIRWPWHSSRSSCRYASANHTVPTGLPGMAPPGPAMPLTASATFAPVRSIAPSAMARTTASLTAPVAFDEFLGHAEVARPWRRSNSKRSRSRTNRSCRQYRCRASRSSRPCRTPRSRAGASTRAAARRPRGRAPTMRYRMGRSRRDSRTGRARFPVRFHCSAAAGPVL